MMKEATKQKIEVCVWVVVFAIGLMLTSCSPKVVTVPEVHDHHHWHTDSVHQTDSVIHEKQTTIMQLDSAAMAKYGIRLNQAERAWLIKTEELQRQIERLESMTADKDTVRDSIPYPVYIKKELTIRDKFSIYLQCMGIVLGILLVCIIIWLITKWTHK